MDRSLLLLMTTIAALGCASGVPKPEVPARAVASPGGSSELAQRFHAQAQRLGELEARVALLEAEARARRSGGATRPTETVRIGAERREEPDEPFEREDPRPVLRLHDQPAVRRSAAPFEPPAPPPGFPDSLPVVPLPEERSKQVLAQGVAQPRADARAEYRAALRLLRKRRYVDAIAAFDAFLVSHPAHALSDNALYWRGEAHYAERRYAQALREFSAVLSRFPNSNKAAESLLKVGMCHMRLGNQAEATRYFERVRAEYPNSAAARSAPPRSAPLEGST